MVKKSVRTNAIRRLREDEKQRLFRAECPSDEVQPHHKLSEQATEALNTYAYRSSPSVAWLTVSVERVFEDIGRLRQSKEAQLPPAYELQLATELASTIDELLVRCDHIPETIRLGIEYGFDTSGSVLGRLIEAAEVVREGVRLARSEIECRVKKGKRSGTRRAEIQMLLSTLNMASRPGTEWRHIKCLATRILEAEGVRLPDDQSARDRLLSKQDNPATKLLKSVATK